MVAAAEALIRKELGADERTQWSVRSALKRSPTTMCGSWRRCGSIRTCVVSTILETESKVEGTDGENLRPGSRESSISFPKMKSSTPGSRTLRSQVHLGG